MNNNEYDQEPLTWDEIKPARVAIQEENTKYMDHLELSLFDADRGFSAAINNLGELVGDLAITKGSLLIKAQLLLLIEKARVNGIEL